MCHVLEYSMLEIFAFRQANIFYILFSRERTLKTTSASWGCPVWWNLHGQFQNFEASAVLRYDMDDSVGQSYPDQKRVALKCNRWQYADFTKRQVDF